MDSHSPAVTTTLKSLFPIPRFEAEHRRHHYGHLHRCCIRMKSCFWPSTRHLMRWDRGVLVSTSALAPHSPHRAPRGVMHQDADSTHLPPCSVPSWGPVPLSHKQLTESSFLLRPNHRGYQSKGIYSLFQSCFQRPALVQHTSRSAYPKVQWNSFTPMVKSDQKGLPSPNSWPKKINFMLFEWQIIDKLYSLRCLEWRISRKWKFQEKKKGKMKKAPRLKKIKNKNNNLKIGFSFSDLYSWEFRINGWNLWQAMTCHTAGLPHRWQSRKCWNPLS